MDMPPTRYRIVERGRRLEVIDTRSGQSIRSSRPDAPSGRDDGRRISPLLRRLGSGDGTGFTTSPLYDAKGPRTLKLNYAAIGRLNQLRFALAIGVAVMVALAFYWLWLIAIVLVIFANEKVRGGIRAAITRYLDSFDQAARDSSSSG